MNNFKFNMLCIQTTFVAFTANCIAFPTFGHANQYECSSFNSDAVLAKIKNAVSELHNLDEDETKLSEVIEILLNVQQALENVTHKKLSLEDALAKVQIEIGTRGCFIPDVVINSFRKQIKMTPREIAPYESYGTSVTSPLYETKFGERPNPKEEEEIVVPVDVAIGITVSLCGVFLQSCSTFFPHYIIYYADDLITMGSEMAFVAGEKYYNEKKDPRR